MPNAPDQVASRIRKSLTLAHWLAGLLSTGLFAVTALQIARADSTGAEKACAAFGWSIDNERAWFASPQLSVRPSGARLRRIDRAVEVTLNPNGKQRLFLAPTVPAGSDGFSGLITFYGVPHPGLYQLTLSDVADVDLFENGARIRPLAAVRAPDCPDAHESVRYQLAPGDLILVQIVNAPHSTIRAAFEEAP